MRIDLQIPITEELAAIFSAEFDSDDTAEKWVAYETKGLTYAQWQDAKQSIEIFRAGLRQRAIILQANNAPVLVDPFCFLLTFTEDCPSLNIGDLADVYLATTPRLSEVKNLLRVECDRVYAKLLPFKTLFYGQSQ